MIARDGWTLILTGLLVTVVALWAATRWDNLYVFAIGVLFAIATLFTVYFFRDPERVIQAEPDMLMAPADGRVVKIDTLATYPFVGDRAIQVSIFLSVFNVHVNRVPTAGTIAYVKYNPGQFLAAYEDKASEVNEQTEIGLVTQSGRKVIFKQIAGIIARRIVCRLSQGETVAAGSRFGMIKFGSRVDLLVPSDSRITVKVGQAVYGGKTVMGYLAPPVTVSNTSKDREEINEQL